jgi:hypothetical protein
MAQKAAVEAVLRDPSFRLRTTMLRPALFMEELWKRYTRPSILRRGTLALALPRDAPLQLTAVRDVGAAAAAAFARPSRYAGAVVDLAGDELTPAAMADAFAAAQRSPVCALALPAWPLRLMNPGLYDIVRFMRDSGYGVDVAACRREHPHMLSFPDFLALTCWADEARSYEGGVRYDDVEALLAEAAAAAAEAGAGALADGEAVAGAEDAAAEGA